MFNRQVFIPHVRATVFRGRMLPEQQSGCTAILEEAERRGLASATTAYILATAWWESGRTMQPVREGGLGHGKKYGVPDPHTHQVYYGRGLVQITWKVLYEKFSKLLNVDLVNHPDLALRDDIAIKILFDGMIGGLFTGRRLDEYIDGNKIDFVDARRVVNGTDQASTIAVAARNFRSGLIPVS